MEEIFKQHILPFKLFHIYGFQGFGFGLMKGSENERVKA